MSGLRERKKQETRTAIAAHATRLFFDAGFERTTIADVAAAAGVAKMTVTNHFRLKEDLLFDRAPEIVDLLAGAVAARPPGVSALEAIESVYAQRRAAHDPILGYMGIQFAELVNSSPALVLRERAMFDEQEAKLSDVLVAELGSAPDDLVPRLAAAQLAGVWRLLYFEGRRRLIAGETTDEIGHALGTAAEIAFGQIRAGLPDAMTMPRAA